MKPLHSHFLDAIKYILNPPMPPQYKPLLFCMCSPSIFDAFCIDNPNAKTSSYVDADGELIFQIEL